MKNTLLMSTLTVLFFSSSQLCGCGCEVNAQTNNQQSIKVESKTLTLKIAGYNAEVVKESGKKCEPGYKKSCCGK